VHSWSYALHSCTYSGTFYTWWLQWDHATQNFVVEKSFGLWCKSLPIYLPPSLMILKLFIFDCEDGIEPSNHHGMCTLYGRYLSPLLGLLTKVRTSVRKAPWNPQTRTPPQWQEKHNRMQSEKRYNQGIGKYSSSAPLSWAGVQCFFSSSSQSPSINGQMTINSTETPMSTLNKWTLRKGAGHFILFY